MGKNESILCIHDIRIESLGFINYVPCNRKAKRTVVNKDATGSIYISNLCGIHYRSKMKWIEKINKRLNINFLIDDKPI